MAQYAPQQSTRSTALPSDAPIGLPHLSLEVGLYVALVVVMLLFRLGGLSLTSLSDVEAHDALAILGRVDHRPAQEGVGELYPINALGGFFNLISFTFMGTGEVAARFPTAIAGLLLTFSPILYRRYVGGTAAFLCVLGLMVSPVLAAASRGMSGMVWASLLLMIGGRLTLHFASSRQSWAAFGATFCLVGILLLTTPYGLLIALGIFFGMAWGILGARSEEDEANATPQLIAEVVRAWPRWEALFAALVGVVLIATACFTAPGGLSSLAHMPDAFYNGLTQRPANLPMAYPLWVSLRYDLLLLVFGIIGAISAWRESTFLERFLTAWLGWAILCCIGYVGGQAELALFITLPAVGLCASFILRVLTTTYYGFWVVPNWLVPVHSLVMAALLVSAGVGLRSQTEQLYMESRVVDYAKVLNLAPSSTDHVRIGTLKPEAEGSSMAFTLPYNEYTRCQLTQDGLDPDRLASIENQWCEVNHIYNVTFVVKALDEAAKEGLLTIRDGQGNIVYGPTTLEDGQDFLFEAIAPEPQAGTELVYTEYRIELNKAEGQRLDNYAQYMVIGMAGDVKNAPFAERLSNGGLFLGLPTIHVAGTIMLRALGGWPFILLLMLALLIPMTFFLVGAFFGARAAWRGIIFGTMLYLALYSLALTWQVTNVYGGDGRELWYLGQALPQDYLSLQTTLEEYSLRDTGTRHEVRITAQTDPDGALAWALREFPHVRFVDQLDPFTTTPVVIAYDTDPRPMLGTEYIGQRLELDAHWELGWLQWTDAGSWLFARRTRFDPQVVNPYRLWIDKTLYDVQSVPE